MMTDSFRARLLRRELLVGTMVTLSAPEVAELLAQVGYDWLFIDAEHAPLGTRELQGLLQGAGAGLPCLVRVAAGAEVPIKQALDVGAAGIIVPQVNSAEQAQHVVRWAKYAPQGGRGVGVGRAHGYGLRMREYMQAANESTAVVVQAEHIEAVRNIEAIVRVPGIDAVLVGPYDLSGSLGLPGQIDHPDVLQAIDRVRQVCSAAGLPLGFFGVSAEAVRPAIDNGYTLIVVGIDTMLLGQAASTLLAQIKG